METTMREKLIQFIHSLTNEECELIVSALKEGLGDADCTAPRSMVFDETNPHMPNK